MTDPFTKIGQRRFDKEMERQIERASPVEAESLRQALDATEPDTPEWKLEKWPRLVSVAQELVATKVELEVLERKVDSLKRTLLNEWDSVERLHGIVLDNGAAVRRVWSVKATRKIEPSRLRELLADAPAYISEQVDMAALHKDYPSIWEQLGKVKREQVINVRLKEEEE
jgi:hypothetical protein